MSNDVTREQLTMTLARFFAHQNAIALSTSNQSDATRRK